MSIIPVICHNFLQRSLNKNSYNYSSNIIKKHNNVSLNDRDLTFDEFRKIYSSNSISTNNTRGGVRL